jgi:hypothetical protein
MASSINYSTALTGLSPLSCMRHMRFLSVTVDNKHTVLLFTFSSHFGSSSITL